MEQTRVLPYEDLIYSHRTTRIYLDELGEIETLPIGIALMVLTTIDEAEAPQVARDLLQRSEVRNSPLVVSRAIIEMVSTIMTYKFINMNRQEVEAMLDITLQETRVYRDAKQEGRVEGQKERRTERRTGITRPTITQTAVWQSFAEVDSSDSGVVSRRLRGFGDRPVEF